MITKKYFFSVFLIFIGINIFAQDWSATLIPSVPPSSETKIFQNNSIVLKNNSFLYNAGDLLQVYFSAATSENWIIILGKNGNVKYSKLVKSAPQEDFNCGEILKIKGIVEVENNTIAFVGSRRVCLIDGSLTFKRITFGTIDLAMPAIQGLTSSLNGELNCILQNPVTPERVFFAGYTNEAGTDTPLELIGGSFKWDPVSGVDNHTMHRYTPANTYVGQPMVPDPAIRPFEITADLTSKEDNFVLVGKKYFDFNHVQVATQCTQFGFPTYLDTEEDTYGSDIVFLRYREGSGYVLEKEVNSQQFRRYVSFSRSYSPNLPFDEYVSIATDDVNQQFIFATGGDEYSVTQGMHIYSPRVGLVSSTLQTTDLFKIESQSHNMGVKKILIDSKLAGSNEFRLSFITADVDSKFSNYYGITMFDFVNNGPSSFLISVNSIRISDPISTSISHQYDNHSMATNGDLWYSSVDTYNKNSNSNSLHVLKLDFKGDPPICGGTNTYVFEQLCFHNVTPPAGSNVSHMDGIFMEHIFRPLTGNYFSCNIQSPSASFRMKDSVNLSDELIDAVVIYPNPNSGEFQLKTSKVGVAYKILNNMGQVVRKPGKINQSTTKIDLSNLPDGIYFIKFQEGSNMKSVRVIKQ